MRWSSSLSDAPSSEGAAEAALAQLHAGLDGARPDLVVAFVSDAHRDRYRELLARLGRALGGALLLGCSARSVIGGGRELEEAPGLALLGAHLPGVRLDPFALSESGALTGPPDASAFLVLADPFSANAEELVAELDASAPEAVKVGGLASGGDAPGRNALFLADRVLPGGAVGVALTGDVAVDAIVAQGCRPIGAPMFATRCEGNLIHELDGAPPLAALQDVFTGLTPEDQALARSSLFLGLAMRREDGVYRQGDFLIRNLIGFVQEGGALAVAAEVDPTQVVQFHLRDARTSAQDLERCLERYAASPESAGARGALLFSCLGRGRYLYGEADHDSRAFRRVVGDVPLGGFFANGEIGPVQGRTYLHGYTSSFAVFRPPG